MAVLSDSDRLTAYAEFLADRNRARDPVECTKTNVRATIDALDAYFNTNAAAINSAIPLPARSQLTTAQKVLIAVFVLQRCWLSGV